MDLIEQERNNVELRMVDAMRSFMSRQEAVKVIAKYYELEAEDKKKKKDSGTP